MDDKKILHLLRERSEEGLKELSDSYGRLALCVAQNILHSREDANECLNDALAAVWEKIPPAEPDPLLPWFLRIVRNIACARRRYEQAQKRTAGDTVPLEDSDILGELALFDESEEDAERIREALNGFLETLTEADRTLFLRRYWFEDPIPDAAARLGITENHARVRLSRCKKKLRQYLAGKGITV